MLGLLVDANSCLHLYVNGMDQGVAAQDIPSPCYPFIDLYGQCEQVQTHTYSATVRGYFSILLFRRHESIKSSALRKPVSQYWRVVPSTKRSKVRVLVSCFRSASSCFWSFHCVCFVFRFLGSPYVCRTHNNIFTVLVLFDL